MENKVFHPMYVHIPYNNIFYGNEGRGTDMFDGRQSVSTFWSSTHATSILFNFSSISHTILCYGAWNIGSMLS